MTVNGTPARAFLASCPPAPGFEPARCTTCSAPMRSDGVACTSVARHAPKAAHVQWYATWTGTRRNLSAMHAVGARVLTGPDQLDRGGLPPMAWCMDNGAWGAFSRGVEWSADRFVAALDRWGHGADWIAAPDVVAGGLDSLALSVSWLDRLAVYGCPVLIPVQDGMTPDDVRPYLRDGAGIFVGGSTAWKWGTLDQWGALAREVGCHLHVARVNSARAIRRCAEVGADSADGTSMTRFGVTAAPLGRAARDDINPNLFA